MSKVEKINEALRELERVQTALVEIGADWRVRRKALEVGRELVMLRGEAAMKREEASS